MDECRGNEHAGAKVAREKEKLVGDAQVWEVLDDEREGTG